jgi:hypothetical protein
VFAALLAAGTSASHHSQGLLGPYLFIGYAFVTSSPASFEPPPHRSRLDQAFGLRKVLTDSAPAPAEVAAAPLWQMPPTAAPGDLAYSAAMFGAAHIRWQAAPRTLVSPLRTATAGSW